MGRPRQIVMRADSRRVTRDVEPFALRSLLDDPPRATVVFADQDTVELLPARVRLRAETHLFGVLAEATGNLEGREVVLVIDDGDYWFHLRGISVRGVAERTAAPTPGGDELVTWYAIAPRRVLAWDYGHIREA